MSRLLIELVLPGSLVVCCGAAAIIALWCLKLPFVSNGVVVIASGELLSIP